MKMLESLDLSRNHLSALNVYVTSIKDADGMEQKSPASDKRWYECVFINGDNSHLTN
ncbi:hypothetical protein MTR_6g015495 [Medicago truncatula]|uniref:Uncharacterized protein n=1 Tax=Medicago truncatula TaxID=3880 RepID=A0A072U5Q7_MEDTR|nr:hypothetical protein MTR_6g015495 [Medicago truncatula]